MKETKKVNIVRNVRSSPEKGTYVSTPTIIATGYITIASARSNTIYQATLREQIVTHEGWTRANSTWNDVNIGDLIQWKTRSLRVVRYVEEGGFDGGWLLFELEEQIPADVVAAAVSEDSDGTTSSPERLFAVR